MSIAFKLIFTFALFSCLFTTWYHPEYSLKCVLPGTTLVCPAYCISGCVRVSTLLLTQGM
uniref:Uncharacterized protein n=1 Tax=Anguilla anguilla TaxID=7936 RepID=A0A0E9XPT4_ANGAN